MADLLYLIPLPPLVAFVINILLGRRFIGDKAHWVALPAASYPEEHHRAAFYDRLIERLGTAGMLFATSALPQYLAKAMLDWATATA